MSPFFKENGYLSLIFGLRGECSERASVEGVRGASRAPLGGSGRALKDGLGVARGAVDAERIASLLAATRHRFPVAAHRGNDRYRIVLPNSA